MLSRSPQPGQIARVRARQYLIEEVQTPQAPEDMTLVRMSCVDDDAQGEPLEIVWETELDAKVLDATSWDHVARAGFDDPDLFSAYLHTQRWHCVTATDPKLFQAPYRAGIDVMAYQLEPLRKALALPRVNLFIADDVGLGKTIEAGLIVRELIMRQKLKRIVIAAPPSVVPQWRDEMEARFGLTFQIYDREYVRRTRQARGFGVNPWQTHSRFIISHALLRDEQYAAPMRQWLGPLGVGAMLILDEAHHAAPASSSSYAVDSKLTKIIRELAPRFEHKLFLSATPHNGHSNSFSALLELLDEQRFCRGVPISGKKELEPVMVRRLKHDLRAIGVSDFPTRHILQCTIQDLPADAPELLLPELLSRYDALVHARLATQEGDRFAHAATLVLTSLQKRLLSSIPAFARTLEVHRQHRQAQDARAIAQARAQLQRRRADLDDEAALARRLDEDELRAQADEAQREADELRWLTLASQLTAQPLHSPQDAIQAELDLLDQLHALAHAHLHAPDCRARWLIDWITTHLLGPLDPKTSRRPWLARRVIIFTEYTDTLDHLRAVLTTALGRIAGDPAPRIAVFDGHTPEQDREQIKLDFNEDPARSPLRILLATDAAREGVNLQNHCADLFHFDIPWNPGRMEQRNGRIDRKLQRSPEVRCHYFTLAQRPEDRVLQTLIQKTDRIQRELGSLSPVITSTLHARLERGGIRRAHLHTLIQDLEAADDDAPQLHARQIVRQELEASREAQQALAAQVEQLTHMLDRAKQRLGLTADLLRQALDRALLINAAQPLEPLDDRRQRWQLPLTPALQTSSWAPTLDTLRSPRPRDMRLAAWRQHTPLRPLIFQDPGTLDQDLVHLHLEHRVVRRLLSRFLAQGFVHDDLSRACVVLSDNAVRRVVLLGKLALFGHGASRLHEEIVAITAPWRQGDDPERLTPYKKDTERMTLELLDRALLELAHHRVPQATQALLASHAALDVAALLPHLQAEADAQAQRALALLTERGQREAKAMHDVMVQQRAKIQKRLDEQHDPQLTLAFNDQERRQLDAERRAWAARLATLADDLQREPARIQAAYDVHAVRLEPLGLVYLWPRSG